MRPDLTDLTHVNSLGIQRLLHNGCESLTYRYLLDYVLRTWDISRFLSVFNFLVRFYYETQDFQNLQTWLYCSARLRHLFLKSTDPGFREWIQGKGTLMSQTDPGLSELTQLFSFQSCSHHMCVLTQSLTDTHNAEMSTFFILAANTQYTAGWR